MRGGEIKYYGETSSLDNRTVDKEKWVFFGGGGSCLFVCILQKHFTKKKEKGTIKYHSVATTMN